MKLVKSKPSGIIKPVASKASLASASVVVAAPNAVLCSPSVAYAPVFTRSNAPAYLTSKSSIDKPASAGNAARRSSATSLLV